MHPSWKRQAGSVLLALLCWLCLLLSSLSSLIYIYRPISLYG